MFFWEGLGCLSFTGSMSHNPASASPKQDRRPVLKLYSADNVSELVEKNHASAQRAWDNISKTKCRLQGVDDNSISIHTQWKTTLKSIRGGACGYAKNWFTKSAAFALTIDAPSALNVQSLIPPLGIAHSKQHVSRPTYKWTERFIYMWWKREMYGGMSRMRSNRKVSFFRFSEKGWNPTCLRCRSPTQRVKHPQITSNTNQAHFQYP